MNLLCFTEFTIKRRFIVRIIAKKVILEAIIDESNKGIPKDKNIVIRAAPTKPPMLNCA